VALLPKLRDVDYTNICKAPLWNSEHRNPPTYFHRLITLLFLTIQISPSFCKGKIKYKAERKRGKDTKITRRKR
jgi:hypothetical protein